MAQVARLGRLGPLFGLALVYSLFAFLAPPSFTTYGTAETIARQAAIVGIASLGMTAVIVAGGIDLSVGSVVALATVVIAALLQAGLPSGIAAVGGVAAGLLCGILNGALITRLRMVPFIVTLGTLLIVRGAAKGLANEQKIDAPATGLNDVLAAVPPERSWQVLPAGVWGMLLLSVAAWLLLRRTRFGRHVFATGGNEEAARLSGVPVENVKLGVYALAGVCGGLAGLLQFSRLTVGDPTVASGLELDVIAAVVIGGGSLSGGEGSIAGSVIGALVMTTIRAGCSQMGMANWIQEIVTGAIIVAAVTMDRLRRR